MQCYAFLLNNVTAIEHTLYATIIVYWVRSYNIDVRYIIIAEHFFIISI